MSRSVGGAWGSRAFCVRFQAVSRASFFFQIRQCDWSYLSTKEITLWRCTGDVSRNVPRVSRHCVTKPSWCHGQARVADGVTRCVGEVSRMCHARC